MVPVYHDTPLWQLSVGNCQIIWTFVGFSLGSGLYTPLLQICISSGSDTPLVLKSSCSAWLRDQSVNVVRQGSTPLLPICVVFANFSVIFNFLVGVVNLYF